MSSRDIWIAVAFVAGLIVWFGLAMGLGFLAPGKHPVPGTPEFEAYARPHVDDCVKRRIAIEVTASGAQKTDTARLQADCHDLFVKTRPK